MENTALATTISIVFVGVGTGDRRAAQGEEGRKVEDFQKVEEPILYTFRSQADLSGNGELTFKPTRGEIHQIVIRVGIHQRC